jgi:hypothetical protein
MSQLSVADRLARIARTKHFWMKYSRGEEVLQLLEDRLGEPQSHRMRNILIIGDSNAGKTRLLLRFIRKHKPMMKLSEASVIPILYIHATEADVGLFYNQILEELPVYKHGQKARSDMKELFVLRAMKDCGIRMLVIDELQHLLNASTAKQNSFRRVIRNLGNQLMIPIVALGNRDAFHAITSDVSLANRFQVVALPKWELNGPLDDQPSEYRQFLAAFERLLPFNEPSDLGQYPMAIHIYLLSEGTIGEASDLLRDAATWAVRNDQGRLTKEALERCVYVPPSKRTTIPV